MNLGKEFKKNGYNVSVMGNKASVGRFFDINVNGVTTKMFRNNTFVFNSEQEFEAKFIEHTNNLEDTKPINLTKYIAKLESLVSI